MKIDILTLFPNMFDGFLSESIVSRAINEGLVQVNIHNFRDYTTDPHHKVDDTPYGGGAGMVLMCQPIFDCIDKIKTEDSIVIMLTPEGKVFNQKMAQELSLKKHLILICGHYEGFDERIKSICDMFISIGDFILTGGELPSMIISDAIIRLIPGVIDSSSLESESFNNNMLDYPTYTKPREYRGMKVPEVLLNGNHQEIQKYREEEALKKTKANRSDLLEGHDE